MADILNEFHRTFSKTDFSETHYFISSTMKTIETIFQSVSNLDQRFESKGGIVGYVGCHIPSINCSESDVLFPIEIDGDTISTDLPEYVKFKPSKTASETWSDCLDKNGCIDPKLLSEKFDILLEQSISKQEMVPVTLTGKGSTATTIQFLDPYNGVSIDVVLTIQCKKQSVLSRCNPFSKTKQHQIWPSDETLLKIQNRGIELVANTYGQNHGMWRLSFSYAETKLLDNARDVFHIFGKLFVILKVLRILYLLPAEKRNVVPKFKSYHLKVIMLHEALDYPNKSEWADDKLEERFTSLLNRLKNCLQVGNLPHFHLPGINLFVHGPPSFLLKHDIFEGNAMTYINRIVKETKDAPNDNYFY